MIAPAGRIFAELFPSDALEHYGLVEDLRTVLVSTVNSSQMGLARPTG